MAKTSSVEKNNRRRKMVKQYANKRAKLKAIIQNKDVTMEERFTAQLKLAELPRNSAKNRIRNRCEVTGRPRAFYRKVKMSRLALREMANQGLIPGMVKSSW
ncbi:30S ribosomal protein S14 [Aestuariivirga litoralis]|uniref:Small ribosomal subunit protein uS14 n=1 Tax=Aestuariivirga litoralis TaxID=2650924 RepID=A0A2W2ANQ5_9HYPH|nr:30S ribosomal protein S14 [Aestuariivirga litoralis]PZF77065.1 30S ribosomal protein S14 [Aestuariivirga litoralis]